MKTVIKKAKIILESLGEEPVDLELPEEIKDSGMADIAEMVREMGRLMIENTNRQLEIQREREEVNIERFKALIEGQQKTHREDAEVLADQFAKMRNEQEIARYKQNQRLPMYDGVNLDIDDWKDKLEATMKCNKWTFSDLMESLSLSLTGQAKRSFDSLTDADKRNKDQFFENMRIKISPQSEKINKELFMTARKGQSESIMTFIDRCRMYIRRSGGDSKDPFAMEML